MSLERNKRFEEEINRIQKEELDSKRYKQIYNFLVNKYYNRNYKYQEIQLFDLIDSLERDINNNISNTSIKEIMINKYYQLIKFLSKVTPDQINSNIYFKKVKEYMDICFKECKKATEELYKTKSYNNKQIELKLESPNYTIDDLPSYINDKVELIEYGIFNNKTRYVDILDWSHRYVYEDYNKFITNSEKLCKIIYILQLNNLLNKELRNFVCSNININNKKFNATITTNKNIENNSKVRKLIK